MKDVTKIVNRLIEIQKELDVRKKLYEEYDELVGELVEAGFKKGEFNDLVVELKNNFEKANTVFRVAGVKLYDVEIISKELAAKRDKKKGA